MNVNDYNIYITWGLTKNFLVPVVTADGTEMLDSNKHDNWMIIGTVTYVPKVDPRPEDILVYRFESDQINMWQFNGKYLQSFVAKVTKDSLTNTDKARNNLRLPVVIKTKIT